MNAEKLKNYYELLGITTDSTVIDIHKAYWHKAAQCHPDRGGSHEEMVQLVEAWKILSDPGKRSRYDQLLKFRHDGWQSNKFNADVQDARKRAKEDAARAWSDFEAIYQKAFYTFNQDFYGEEIAGKAAGPYSPLMGSKKTGVQGAGYTENKRAESRLNRAGGTMFVYIMKTCILFAAILAAFLFYRNYSGVGRYVPLGQQDASSLLILDTTNGAVYSVDKRDGTLTSPWKKIVTPFPRENTWPGK